MQATGALRSALEAQKSLEAGWAEEGQGESLSILYTCDPWATRIELGPQNEA